MHRWTLFIVIGLLTAISYSTLASIVPDLAARQGIFILLGLSLFFLIRLIPFLTWIKISPLLYVILQILLVITLFMPTAKGAARWIDIGPISFQPSQLAIPTTLLFLGWLQARPFGSWYIFILMVIAIAVPAALIFVEPDLGTTLMFGLVTATALLLSSNWKQLSLLVVIGVFAAVVGWFTVVKEYQKARITSFLDPHQTASSTGYNAYQAKISVGSGGLMGRGAGKGIQSHLKFLPEKHTDFFFASFAEEYGFIGSMILSSLYIGLVGICISVALRAERWSEMVFTAAVGCYIGLQSFYNIGMNAGLFPITGIPLPLASYGGTAMLTIICTLAIVNNVLQNLPKKVTLHVQ